jgi:hypothetical protein
MTIRKCIYTNKEAKSKDSVIPRHVLGEEIQNWASYAPSNIDYSTQKSDKLPSELEMQANEFFHLLELARLRVVYYEQKLAETQAEILKTYKEPIKNKITVADKKKEKQIKQMVVEKEITEEVNKDIENFLEQKRKLWE